MGYLCLDFRGKWCLFCDLPSFNLLGIRRTSFLLRLWKGFEMSKTSMMCPLPVKMIGLNKRTKWSWQPPKPKTVFNGTRLPIWMDVAPWCYKLEGWIGWYPDGARYRTYQEEEDKVLYKIKSSLGRFPSNFLFKTFFFNGPITWV